MHLPLLALTLVAGFATASSPPDDAAHAIAFETIAVMSDTTGINLVPHVPIAVRNADDLADLERIIGDGVAGDLPDRVIAAVEQVPTGMMPLVGIIDTGCSPPSTPGLSIDADGNVAMYALDPVPRPAGVLRGRRHDRRARRRSGRRPDRRRRPRRAARLRTRSPAP